MNHFEPTSVPPSGGIRGAMRLRLALFVIAIVAIVAFLGLRVPLLVRTASAQAVDPTATVHVWNITGPIGHNPDAAREDILGLTGHVNTAANPQTVVAVIDNGNNSEGPCGLIFMNPATNVFLDYGLGFGFADGIDINQTAPLLTGPISTVFGAAIFQPGDTWGGISGSPPLFVNLKGTNNFRFYSVSSARGVKINQLTGKVFFTDSFGGTINQLDPSTNILTTWSVGGNPYYLTIDSSGNIFVAVALAGVAGGMDAIVKLTPGGAFTAWKIPGGGLAPGFNGLALNGIALDTAGNVWVALSASNEVGRLNPGTNQFCKFTQAGLTAHPQQIASTGAGATLQAFWTEAGAGEGGSDLMGAVTVLTQSSAVPETSPSPCPAPTPATGTLVPSTFTASFSDSIRMPRLNTITPLVTTVTSTSTPGIDRFPMPFPTGGTPTAPNAPSGMTGVVLPNTVFGTYQDTSFTTNSAFFEVNSPVIIAPPPGDAPITATGVTFSATEGQPFAGTVATFHDPDPMSTAAEYNATIDWGDASSTSMGTITLTSTSSSGNNFAVTGSHTYTEEGTYTVKVTITDVDNPSNTATATSTAKVVDAALHSSCAAAPVSPQSFSGPTATLTDDNSFASKADFTATINWGDSTSSSGTVSGGPGAGPYTVSGSHTYSTTGTFTITTTINDDGGAKTVATCHVIVFAFPTATGAFVIGDLADPPPIVGDSVTWWSSQWAQLNPMSGGPAPASMKGFAGFEDNPLGTPRTCGSSWTTDTGNATPPPPSVPTFMGVLVSSVITQNGSVITGNIKQVVVVHNNPGYAPDPGHTGTGTIVAIVCVGP